MVGVNAFVLALLLFGVALIAPIGAPIWLWSLNAAGIAYCLGSGGFWIRRANRET
jgi:threonine/homoserine efflux transporter RhtA